MTDSTPATAACPDCRGSGIQGGAGSYYDVPGKGKPCGSCDGTGTTTTAAGCPFCEAEPGQAVTATARQAVAHHAHFVAAVRRAEEAAARIAEDEIP